MTDDDPGSRLRALEDRVAALEAAVPGRSTPPERAGEAGQVGYDGEVRLDPTRGPVSWTIRYDAATLVDRAGAEVADVLAALGHPARLAILRRLLTGDAGTGELVEAAALSSTGQLHHHLRTLTGAGLVEQDGRTYRVPATGVVPVLVALLAAADLGGLLR